MKHKLGIVVALPREAQSIQASVKISNQPVSITPNCYLYISGMGFNRARFASEELVAKGCDHLISWGSCVALDPDLNCGDLIIPDSITSPSSTTIHLTPPGSEIIRELQNTKLNIYHGQFTHCEQILTNEKTKQSLRDSTNAIAADMESYAVAQVAELEKMPCTIYRSVSDKFSFRFPNKFTQHISEFGEPIMPDFAFAIARYPHQLLALIKLGLGFNQAIISLKKTAKILL